MLKIREAIVVEGKYDKNTLSQIVDAVIIETSGFGIFSDSEKIDLLRRIAEKRGLVIFTDSDGAGFVIRNRLKSIIPKEHVKHAYIPEIAGKEKRKKQRSKEGILGVEGVDPEILLNALRRSGAIFEDFDSKEETSVSVTKADLMELGLTGCERSREKRVELTKKLALPEKMSANALLDVINALFTYDEFLTFL